MQRHARRPPAERAGALHRSLPPALGVLRRGPADLPRSCRYLHRALRRLGVARSPGHGVHERASQREPGSPRRSPRRAGRGPRRWKREPVRRRHGDFRVHAIGGEFAQFRTWLRCTAANCGVAAQDSAHAYVKGVFLRTEDRATPELVAVGGSLLLGPGGARRPDARSRRGGPRRGDPRAVGNGERARDSRRCPQLRARR